MIYTEHAVIDPSDNHIVVIIEPFDAVFSYRKDRVFLINMLLYILKQVIVIGTAKTRVAGNNDMQRVISVVGNQIGIVFLFRFRC